MGGRGRASPQGGCATLKSGQQKIVADLTDVPPQNETLSEAASEVRLVYTAFAKQNGNGMSEPVEGPLHEATTSFMPELQVEQNQVETSTVTSTSRVNGYHPPLPLDEEPEVKVKEWQKDSCILVMGSVKAGKSTTINLYTDNSAGTGAENRVGAETAEISFYEDILHKAEVEVFSPN